MSDQLDREKLKELCAKATPGPWEADDRSFGDDDEPPYGPYGYISTGGVRGKPILQAIQSQKVNDDLRFVVAARAALPQLLEANERLEAQLAAETERAEASWQSLERVKAKFADATKQLDQAREQSDMLAGLLKRVIRNVSWSTGDGLLSECQLALAIIHQEGQGG